MIKYNQKYDRWVTDTGIVYRQNNTGAFVVCKQSNDVKGYKYIKVSKPYNTHIKIHRLVWETFNGLIPDGMVIDHEDTHKDNNVLSNLKMCTPKENMNNPLTKKHCSEAHKGKTTFMKGKTVSEFGRKFKEHFGMTRHQNINLYSKELMWYINHNKVCRWEVNNENG